MSKSQPTKWVRVFALIPGSAMNFMDQSILPVALPVIQKDFGADNTSLHWTVNAYLLSLAVFVLIAGKISDIIGHRRALLLGIFLFTFFSIFCGLSMNVQFLVVSRAFQGIGAAIIFPSQSSLIATSFPKESRGRAIGIIVSSGSIFLALGPLVGGYFTEWLDWRWIFWINVPIALIGIFLIFALIQPTPKNKGKVDFLGFLFFSVFSTSIATFFMQVQDWGWSLKSITCALIALIFLFLTLFREKKEKHPFMELNLFKKPLFAALSTNIIFTQFILMIIVFRTVYMEKILGYSPSITGLIVAATSLPVLFLSYVGGYLSDKISPKFPIAMGYCFMIISFVWLGIFNLPSTWSLCLALILFSMGIPLILTPSFSTVMGAISPGKLGVAFGLISTLRMMGATIGLSLIFVITGLEQKIQIPLIGERLAVIKSFSLIHFILAIVMIIACFTSFYLPARKSRHQLPKSPAEGWD